MSKFTTAIRFNSKILYDTVTDFHKTLIPHTITLESTTKQSDDIRTFVFTSRKSVHYKAGQYGIFFLPLLVKGKPARLFTVASTPNEGTITVTTHISGSDYKQKMSRLQPGAKVRMLGPIGHFTLSKQPEPVVLIAGGIGVTAIRVLAKELSDTAGAEQATIIYSANNEYTYADELKQLIKHTVLTNRQDLDNQLSNIAAAQPNAKYYISGPPGFVVHVEQVLKDSNVSSIITDGFVGY